jgi:hypothetical protein
LTRGYEILASRIGKELKKTKHCALYEPDLSRVWPDDGRQRDLKSLPSPKRMAGGFATKKTDSAQFSMNTRLTKEASSWFKNVVSFYLRAHNESRSVAAMRISNPD